MHVLCHIARECNLTCTHITTKCDANSDQSLSGIKKSGISMYPVLRGTVLRGSTVINK